MTCEVKRVDSAGMILIRADLGNEEAATAIAAALDCKLPNLRSIAGFDGREVAWMAPDELLLFVPLRDVNETIQALNEGLQNSHHLVADVSSMRTVFDIFGPVRDILAKGTPADVSPRTLQSGEIRRSRIGQVQAAFWITSAHSVRVICRRSESEYLRRWLTFAASPDNRPNFFHR